MLSNDQIFLEMFRYSYTAVSTLDLYTGTTLVRKDVSITGGTVSAARKSNARRTFDAVIALNDWEDLPIDTFSTRVKVNVGLEVLPGVRQTVPQGTFRVESVSRARRGEISLSGTSLEAYVIDDRFFTPRTPTKGNGTILSIKTLILESLPDTVFLVTATMDKVVGMTAPWERERWEAVTALADSINAEVYCGADGRFVIADKPDFAVINQNPVWRVNAGPDGVLVTENVSETRDKVYNAVVASGQSSDQDVPPVWDVVTDNNPNSRTYWGGPFGHVPRFYANPNFTTKAQCTSAATNMLAESVAENREVDFSMAPNPALEPGDVIQLSMLDGTVENHTISELSIPLGLGPYTAKTLASKVEIQSG
jgi:Domain of unknown function (DUF5047)